jgi:hypothetical protein
MFPASGISFPHRSENHSPEKFDISLRKLDVSHQNELFFVQSLYSSLTTTQNWLYAVSSDNGFEFVPMSFTVFLLRKKVVKACGTQKAQCIRTKFWAFLRSVGHSPSGVYLT